MGMDTEERWVDVEEVSKHLGVRRESIYRWIESKEFPAHRAGRLFRFKLSEVDEWMRKGGGEEQRKAEDKNEEDRGE
jgi:excisionase family DNA binding protein